LVAPGKRRRGATAVGFLSHASVRGLPGIADGRAERCHDGRVRAGSEIIPNRGSPARAGPGRLGFSILRRFRLRESKALEFRAEMFNLFNRANFATPERDLSSASFGEIFNTVQPLAGLASGGPGDPREIQFALRLIW